MHYSDAEERAVLDSVDLYLERGLALRRWWMERQADRNFENRFELAFTFNRPDVSFGFFDQAPVDGKQLPVLGNYQTQFYDQPKSPTTDQAAAGVEIDRQLRQFVLRYFLRVSDFREPQPFTRGETMPPGFLRPFSMCTGEDVRRQGFGYAQLFYKRRGSGEIGRFPESERNAIVDLREIGTTFEWIVVKVDIFDFSFSFQPFGPQGPFLTLPLAESSYLVLTREFILNDTRPHPGELGHYGFGYAFIKNPSPSLLGWGPGEFDAAFQTIDFHVYDDGRIRVSAVFVANRPTQIINLPLDPFRLAAGMINTATGGMASPFTAPLSLFSQMAAGFQPPSIDPVFAGIAAANLFTGGLASRKLCISREQLEKGLILKHFSQHYSTITGSLQTWRQIRNWLDEATLPRWVVTGKSA